MRKLSSLSLLVIHVLLVSSQANSQLKSSATQTLTFAVNRSVQSTLKIFANSQSLNLVSRSSESTAFRSSLEKMSVKVTVAEISNHTAAVSSKTSDVHIDVRAAAQAAKNTIERIPKVITVTE